MHIAVMGVQITIRNVDPEVRDILKARAARQDQSMEEYLRAELKYLASKPSIDEWLEEVRAHKADMTSRVTTGSILRYRDADKR
ncbi:MAG: hypothetical protein OXC56_01305 [Chloroflexi bacterium]|nr:hypothetical protein [Chloroflexota bacterium]